MVSRFRVLAACAAAVSLSGGFGPFVQPARRVSAFVGVPGLMPKVKRQTLPAYPAEGAPDGVVDLEVVVDREGHVAHARTAQSPDPTGVLDRTCVEALNKWQLNPAMSDSGQYMATLVRVRFSFAKPAPGRQAGTVSAALIGLPLSVPPDFDMLGSLVVRDTKEPGFTWPAAVREVQPRYTPEAMRAKIQGVVSMELVVLPDGTVGAARLVKTLEESLDRVALVAARYWYFTPPKINGVPVAAKVLMDLEFRLH